MITKLCRVPRCNNRVHHQSPSGVCSMHTHAAGVCRCSQCRKRASDQKYSGPHHHSNLRSMPPQPAGEQVDPRTVWPNPITASIEALCAPISALRTAPRSHTEGQRGGDR